MLLDLVTVRTGVITSVARWSSLNVRHDFARLIDFGRL
jgi:hypothetical protein